MAHGKVKVKAANKIRAVEVVLKLDTKGKAGENAGLLANLSNELHDVLRKHFCAHQVKTITYVEPPLPARLTARSQGGVKLKIGGR